LRFRHPRQGAAEFEPLSEELKMSFLVLGDVLLHGLTFILVVVAILLGEPKEEWICRLRGHFVVWLLILNALPIVSYGLLPFLLPNDDALAWSMWDFPLSTSHPVRLIPAIVTDPFSVEAAKSLCEPSLGGTEAAD